MIQEAASEYVWGVKGPQRVANKYKISVLKKIIMEELNEVYSEKQRRWACAQTGDDFEGDPSLNKKEAEEMCKGPMKEELEELATREEEKPPGVEAIEADFETSMTDEQVGDLVRDHLPPEQQKAAYSYFTQLNIYKPPTGDDAPDVAIMERRNMKITRSQLKQIIKEELSDLRRQQHDDQRGIKKGHRITGDIATYIRSLPDWEEYTTAEVKRRARRGEFAGYPEKRLMKLAGGLYGEYGHKWEEHLPNIKNYIEDVTSPTYLSHVARTN